MNISDTIISIKNSFSRDKLTLKQADEILADIEAELEMSSNIDLIIEDLSNSYKKGKKQLIVGKINDLLKKDIQIQDAFLQHSLITKNEYLLFKENSGGIGSAIKRVSERREESGKFDTLILTTFLPVFLILLASLVALKVVVELLMWFFEEEIMPTAIKMHGYRPEVDFPFYIADSSYIDMWIFSYLAICSLFVYLFYYFYTNDIKVIYTVFRMKMLDDLISHFTIMLEMKRNGVPAHDIHEHFSESIFPKSLRPMYKEMAEKDFNLYETFYSYGISEDIINKYKNLEKTDKLWKKMEYEEAVGAKTVLKGLLPYLHKKLNRAYDLKKKYLRGSVFFLSFLFFTTCVAIPIIVVMTRMVSVINI